MPKIIYSTEYGTPKYKKVLPNDILENIIINPKKEDRGILKISKIMKNGIIWNFEILKKIFDKIFYELEIKNMNISLLITIPSLFPNYQIEKLTDLFFNKFNVSSIYFGNQGLLSLYSYGLKSGISLESGEDITHFTSIIYDNKIELGIDKINLGGNNIDKFLEMNLKKEGYFITNKKQIREIKELYCVTDSYNKLSLNEEDYILPDGSKIKLKKDILKSGNILFNPNLLNLNINSITDTLIKTIQNCDIEIRKYFYENIVISGGNTWIKNFDLNLNEDLLNKLDKNIKFSIISNENRKFSNWIGGSILSTWNSYNDLKIYKNNYNNY